jgi:hypothetical protein
MLPVSQNSKSEKRKRMASNLSSFNNCKTLLELDCVRKEEDATDMTMDSKKERLAEGLELSPETMSNTHHSEEPELLDMFEWMARERLQDVHQVVFSHIVHL